MRGPGKVLMLSAIALVAAGAVLAQGGGPPAARVTVFRIPNPSVQTPESGNPAHWLYRVRPATIVLERNVKKLYVTNFTDLEMSVDLPVDFPATGKPTSTTAPGSNRKRSVIDFKDLVTDEIDGAFSYEVTLKDPKTGNVFKADGESSPRVIIDP